MEISAAAHYRILVIGGGAGGCAASHRFRKLAPRKQLAVIEPNEVWQLLFITIE